MNERREGMKHEIKEGRCDGEKASKEAGSGERK